MFKKITIVVVCLLFIVPVIIFRNDIQREALDLYYYSPCEEPLKYTIGTIDSGFNTTRDELLKDTLLATEIWNNSINQELLKYDPSSSFTVNLVYDDRQELTSKIDRLNDNLEKQQSEIDPKIEDFEKKQKEFNEKVIALNQDISRWNSQGGAPKEEYEKLIARQNELKEEANALSLEAEALGQETSQYNLEAKNLNNTIRDYKGVLVTKPEEGLYEQEGGKRKISIYIDVSHDEFLHTLTHEFGHALNLSHNSNPQSIMYPQTTDVLVPSNEEIEELKEVCTQKSIVEIYINRLTFVLGEMQKRIESNLQR